MEPQRVKADNRIEADVDMVALRYGPLVYNVETADQQNIEQPLSGAPLEMEWRPDLLDGVMAMTGKWQDGSPMLAVPNYARMNRVGQPKEHIAADSSINYAPGSTAGTGSTPTAASNAHRFRTRTIHSKVWIADRI
jgi:hypothetical protein